MAERVGFFEMMGSLLRAPFEERRARVAQATYETAQYEAGASMMQEVVRRVQPEADGWVPLGDDGAGRELDPAKATELRTEARKAARTKPHSVGYLGTLKRFVLGRGVSIDPVIESEDAKDSVLEWWRRFRAINAWDRLEDQIPFQLWRDGEVFVRRFISEGDTDVQLSSETITRLQKIDGFEEGKLEGPDIPEGMVEIRLVPPEQIMDPEPGGTSHGILTKEDDVQTVYGYMWSTDGKKVRAVIPAQEMIHEKIGADLDVKRGRSILEPILERQANYDDWLKYRLALNLARTAVVWVKTIKGTPTQLADIRAKQDKQLEDSSNDRKQRMVKPLTTIHATEGISYEFKSPDLQASDAQHDGRAIQLTMAVATGLAEYIFTGDASNANYASTMVAQSPTVRVFEDWQDSLAPLYERIFRWVIDAGIDAGEIEGITLEEFRAIEVVVSYPPLLSRDEKENAEANEIRSRGGVLSKQGWAELDGIDWQRERDRLEAEFEDDLGVSPVQALPALDRLIASGGLTTDTNLETWVRRLLGIPAKVAEEPSGNGDGGEGAE